MQTFEHYEQEIVGACLRDPGVLSRVAVSSIEPARMSNRFHIWFLSQALAYFKTYKTVMPPKVGVQLISEIQDSDKAKLAYLETYEQLLQVDIESADFSTDRLSAYMKRQKFLEVCLKTVEVASQTDNLDEAYNVLFSHIVHDRKDDRFKFSDYFATWSARKISRLDWKDRPRGIPFGFEALDRATDGMKPGELWAVLGKTGTGKSISLVNWGANFIIKHPGNLLHITTENPLFQVEGRYDSRLTGHPYKLIQRWEVAKEEESFMDLRMVELAHGKSRFRLCKCPPQSTSTLVIWEMLILLEMEGFKPDLIIIDSLEHIVPVTKVREARFRFSFPFWEMKSLLIDLEIPSITSCQAKREAKSNALKLTDMSEAYEKSRVLDGLIGLNRPDGAELMETGFGFFNILKNRDGNPWGKDDFMFDGRRMIISPVQRDLLVGPGDPYAE